MVLGHCSTGRLLKQRKRPVCDITLVRMLNQRKRPVLWDHLCSDGWMDGSSDRCNKLILETAQPIFLKLGMKLGDNKGKKIAEPFFEKKISYCPKMAILAQNRSFCDNAKNRLQQISKIALKLCPKLVL